jgi:hypothetical protein
MLTVSVWIVILGFGVTGTIERFEHNPWEAVDTADLVRTYCTSTWGDDDEAEDFVGTTRIVTKPVTFLCNVSINTFYKRSGLTAREYCQLAQDKAPASIGPVWYNALDTNMSADSQVVLPASACSLNDHTGYTLSSGMYILCAIVGPGLPALGCLGALVALIYYAFEKSLSYCWSCIHRQRGGYTTI